MNNLIKNIDLNNLRFSLSTNKRATIFVHSDTDLSRVNEKKDLILSPAYYWCKKEDLEISSLRKAKKLSESIFFSSLPEGNFKYLTVKKNDEFFFFAYDEKNILDTLKAQGLKEEFLGNIYFAQNEIDSEKAVKITDEISLMKKDSMVLVIPSVYTQNSISFSSLNLKLSNNFIKIKVNTIGKEKDEQFYKIASIFLAIWLVGELVNTYLLQNTLEKIIEKKEVVAEKYKLPTTSFQLDAIEKKYSKIEDKQGKIREVLTAISSFSTNEKEYFQEVRLEKSSIKAIFFYENSKSKAKILKNLKKSFKGASIKQNVKTVEIGVKI